MVSVIPGTPCGGGPLTAEASALTLPAVLKGQRNGGEETWRRDFLNHGW
jgi:hypothetical protein